MKKTLFAFACVALLSGCADMDMDKLLSFGDDPEESEPAVVPEPQPVAAAPASDTFCRAVAAQDSTRNAFDDATQRRILAQTYAQCMALNAR